MFWSVMDILDGFNSHHIKEFWKEHNNVWRNWGNNGRRWLVQMHVSPASKKGKLKADSSRRAKPSRSWIELRRKRQASASDCNWS